MSIEDKKSTNTETVSCNQLDVFYDGSCPLCRAEIGLYRSSGAKARFCDISQGCALPENRSHQDMMARFHVRTEEGRLLSGAAAFAELWKQTPGWRWLGHIVARVPFVWIAEGLYRIFLLVRPLMQGLARRMTKD